MGLTVSFGELLRGEMCLDVLDCFSGRKFYAIPRERSKEVAIIVTIGELMIDRAFAFKRL
jgi:hypothetical protein